MKTILQRINELKCEKVHLRPFILSDVARMEQLDRAIFELEWVYALVASAPSLEKMNIHQGS